MADEPTSQPPGREPQVGDFVGHYRLVELLAVGGMGMIFKPYSEARRRYVAVKNVSPQLAADPARSQRFLAEARALANLNHPNTIQIHFVGQHQGVPFFAMELVDGFDLETVLREQKQFEVAQAVQII